MKLYKNLKEALNSTSQVKALKLSISSPDCPLEIFDLFNLEELYLEGFVKHFDIPQGALNNLKVLSIKWESFEGMISSLFKLPRLENLKLINTPLQKLFLPIGYACSPLKSLTLKNCELQNLPEEFSVFTTLQELNLSGNLLTELPQSFKELQSLKRVNLDSNQFTQFPDLIGSMKKLIHLSIDNNPFNEQEKARIQRQFNIWI